MPRIQGLKEQICNDDVLLKTGPGELHSVTISFAGATIGNKVIFRDGIDGAAQPWVVFVLPTANGILTKEWPQGKRFEVGIYYDDQGPGGTIDTEVTFK